MFAYTGLTPQQMEILAKEVRQDLVSCNDFITDYTIRIRFTLPKTGEYPWLASRPVT